MKLGILREGKNPPDRRVPLTPLQCLEVEKKYQHVKVVVQPSAHRCYSDDEYLSSGIEVTENLNDCDVLLGVKEVPPDDLIPAKTYLFFSHTIKKQEYNRLLLQTILKKKIRLVDYELLTDDNGLRIIGFGRYAGLVGAYSGLRAYGLRQNLFDLKPAHECSNLQEMFHHLGNLEVPPLKIAVTGDGRVANGVIEVLDYLKAGPLAPEAFLTMEKPDRHCYTQLYPRHYVRRTDGSPFDLNHFFNFPAMYENAFLPFAAATDMLIAAAYWHPDAPVLFTQEQMRNPGFRIQVISDITCDIEGSIPSTKRAATIDEPYYDYNPITGKLEPPFSSGKNVTVQAVDNLPNELPVDASEDFGRNLIDKVFPQLLHHSGGSIIDGATIARDGELTPSFLYLRGFAEGG